MKAAISATVCDARSAAERGASMVASATVICLSRCRTENRFPLFLASLLSIPSPRDHVGLVVEPQPAVLAQHLARRIEIAAVADHAAEPVVLDLRHVNR